MMNKIISTFLLLCFLFIATASHAASNVLTLAQNNHSDYVIVLENDAIPAEKTAAQELQKYFLQMTDVTLPIKLGGDLCGSNYFDARIRA